MPPKTEITQEKILDAALALVRQGGMEAVTARAVAARLRCSTQPIYSACGGMDDLRRAAYAAALDWALAAMRRERLRPDAAPVNVPLSLGLGYLRLAAEERPLYRAVFLSDWAGRVGAAALIGREMLSAHAADSSRLPRLGPEDLDWLCRRMTEYLTGLGALVSAGLAELPPGEGAARIAEMYELLTDARLARRKEAR